MNEIEFKLKYPQHSHLEGNDLWNMMEDTLLQSDNCLYADPNQVKIYSNPITLSILQNDGTYAKSQITMEDTSTTRWLNKDGELVREGEIERPVYGYPDAEDLSAADRSTGLQL